jgi:Glu-tRNA(Gln) amidotransferase subunit E-like FAD-binding protein
MVYGCLFYGLEGLFRKDHPDSLAYGRHLCDQVRLTFGCHGFFTSDELPRYGITRGDTRNIFMHMEKEELDGNLIVFCAYQEVVAARIRAFLIAHFRQEIEAP